MKRSIVSWTSVVAMVIVFGTTFVAAERLVASPGGPLAEFTADYRSVEDGKTVVGKFFFGNPGFRMEGSEDGAPIITLFNRSRKQMISIVPEHRMYMEIPFDADNLGFLSAESDSPTACGIPGEATLLGRETLHGRAVERWRCIPRDGKPMTVWYDPRLQLSIKSERDDGGLFELSNIQERRVDPGLFEVPAGYSSPFGGMGGMFGGGGTPQPPPGGMPPMPGTPPPRSR